VGRERGDGAVRRFVRQVRASVAVDLVSNLIVVLVIALGGAAVTAIVRGGDVPAWSLAALVVVAIALCLLVYRRAWSTARTEEQYLQHLAQILTTLQEIITDGDGEANLEDFVCQGMLAPAKDMLTRQAADDIRLSVLVPRGEVFKMRFWAGHRLQSAKRFEIPIQHSISRVAFENGTSQAWQDVHADDRYADHPKATRSTRAMVSVPLTVSGKTVGVFNAVSDRDAGFTPADRLYVECLGAIIEVVVGIQPDMC
jgi:GAF domain